ncbi:MAG: FG-GAP-like repeat-containing protein [Bacteroidia bacterium]
MNYYPFLTHDLKKRQTFFSALFLVAGNITRGKIILLPSFFLFSLFLYIPSLFAQTFTEVSPGPPIEAVNLGAIALGDLNGDSHPDVLISGYNASFTPIAKLYTNDGNGGFTEVTGTPFEGVYLSSIALGDINGDSHPDVLITGQNASFNRITKLYTNDGTGVFTEAMGTPFEGISYGSLNLGDLNGDTHLDVLITGLNGSIYIAKLYTNDGTGGFTEVIGTPFEGVDVSSAALGDINGDNHPDVLISGRNASSIPITKLYTNDGTGVFTEVVGTPFEGVSFCAVALGDLNGDSHPDVLITGLNASSTPISKLYANDGTGGFTEVMGTPFEGVNSGTVNLGDVDGDTHPEILITGFSSKAITRLYTNNGTGGFTEVTNTPFDGVSDRSVVLGDVNGDIHPDVLITGLDTSFSLITKLYTNDGPIPSPATALHFDGQDDYVSLPDSMANHFSAGQISVTAWGYLQSLQSGSTIIQNSGETIGGAYYLGVESQKLVLRVQQSDGNTLFLSSPDSFPLNTWVHAGFTADGDSVSLYQDGLLVAATSYDGTLNTGFPATFIGASPNDSANGISTTDPGSWHGKLDEIGIWERGLTSKEMAKFATCRPAPVEPGLLAYYDFNQGIAGLNNPEHDTLFDDVNDYHGIFQNHVLKGYLSNWTQGNELETCWVTDIEKTFSKEISEIQLAPNPATDMLNIILQSKEKGEATVKLFDLSGRMILSQQAYLTGGHQTLGLDVRNLRAGMYIISLQMGSARYSRKFIKVD